MSAVAPTMLATAPTTPAISSTTPTTRHPLLCYKGRQINDTDLLRLSTKLFSLLALTTYRVIIIITMRNGAMTTATTVMPTRRKAQRPDNFVTTTRFLSKDKCTSIILFIFGIIFFIMSLTSLSFKQLFD